MVVPRSCYLGVAAAVEHGPPATAGRCAGSTSPTPSEVLAAAEGADLVWLESPTNPTIEVADLPADRAELPAGVRLVVDNTFATPLLQRPLELGADIVVHSVTKLLSGHSDVLLGALVTGGRH